MDMNALFNQSYKIQITPLVTYGLKVEIHIQTHTYANMISRNQAHVGLQPAWLVFIESYQCDLLQEYQPSSHLIVILFQ